MANEQTPIDLGKVKLPPPFQELVDQLRSDRKKRMKDPAFAKPDQLRNYLGLHLMPRLEKFLVLLSGGLAETYDISASNLREFGLLRSFVIKQLRAQGVEIPPEIEQQLPDDVEELVDEVDQALFKLATVLSEKLPNDKEAEGAFNNVRELFDDLVDELLGADDDEKEKEPEADGDAGSGEPEAEGGAGDGDEKE